MPLGNEVGLWHELFKFVISWVGCCFIIADGHFMATGLNQETPFVESRAQQNSAAFKTG